MQEFCKTDVINQEIALALIVNKKFDLLDLNITQLIVI